jgi:L-ascorbate metabolism protein UlaG (beta-lactamase superfamily)
MQLTYYGHSAFQIDTNGSTLVFDPFITGNPHAEGIVSAEDLEADVLLLTHAHGDHFGDTPSILDRTDAFVVANHEIVQYLSRKYGYKRAQGMNTGGSWAFDWGRVRQTYARHSSSFPDGTYGGNPNGFILEIDGRCIYNTGDTEPFAEMAWIGDDYDVDVALMPIGDCFTMGPSDALRAVGMIKPKLTIPLHYDTFPPIEVDLEHWERLMADAGFETRVLAGGETLDL